MSNEDKTIHNAGPDQPLAGRIALVAGATRGAGRAQAVELGRAGATVYVTGRTTRTRASEVGRTSETIEETAEFVTAAGGTGIAVPTDHLDEDQVRALARRIDREQGRLDVLGEETGPGSPPLRATASQRPAGCARSPHATTDCRAGRRTSAAARPAAPASP
ncbi:SDR family NAD(P)-dependent oxidoreductase [Streptomyces virginiae]|uniref:SDR family NAD(P)-dependent oxidoreductase n=1 Tax=Streptomyces virginiae TaxID=1961 RepID=UPI00341DA242